MAKQKEISLKAYGKINLGLDVLGTLPNGYHEVRMIMQSVGIHDTVSVRYTTVPGITVLTDSGSIPCDEHNLAYRAAVAMMREHGFSVPQGQGLEISIAKRIPVAAGMAGGSADCAAVLHALNILGALHLSATQLAETGVKLGADVPYCLSGGTMLSEGIGEILTRLDPPPQCHVVLAKPSDSVSTRYVYEHLQLELVKHPDIPGMLRDLQEHNLTGLCGKMGNVLESVTGPLVPVIGQIETVMREHGALAAMMSGSGPTVFGLFTDREKAAAAAEAIQGQELTQEVFLTELTDPGKENLHEYGFESGNG